MAENSASAVTVPGTQKLSSQLAARPQRHHVLAPGAAPAPPKAVRTERDNEWQRTGTGHTANPCCSVGSRGHMTRTHMSIHTQVCELAHTCTHSEHLPRRPRPREMNMCTHMHTHLHTQACTHTHRRECAHTCTHGEHLPQHQQLLPHDTHTNVHTHEHTHTCACTHTHRHVCAHTCMSMHTYTQMFERAHIHTDA